MYFSKESPILCIPVVLIYPCQLLIIEGQLFFFLRYSRIKSKFYYIFHGSSSQLYFSSTMFIFFPTCVTSHQTKLLILLHNTVKLYIPITLCYNSSFFLQKFPLQTAAPVKQHTFYDVCAHCPSSLFGNFFLRPYLC